MLLLLLICLSHVMLNSFGIQGEKDYDGSWFSGKLYLE